MPEQRNTLEQWRGHEVVDQNGAKAGTLEDVLYDEQTGQPEWGLIQTGLFGKRETVVPLTNVSFRGDQICVPYDKDTLKGAPNVDADQDLSQQEEKTLAQHYGLSYSEAHSKTGLPEGGAGKARGPGQSGRSDDAMTRSEEELRVGKARRPSELVRLRKHIVTEPKQVTVPVEREEVRVEREPITDENIDEAMAGPELRESEHEATLHEEEVVVEKRAVPKERVRLEKDTVTDEEEVKEEVRKEQIDVERARPRDKK
jgi:uncharacterized protein (TIGR02271 family)